ncbi:LuxR C-terminal-related transcriptional regulator [Krasilnikovia sp. M28-CT-15]|uniref:helix-turn-helix transcriptional regulator n=1 Tax=Krasilnikovia sp. M28-CT-15 TaxID=3373540 RepID=UPI003876421E
MAHEPALIGHADACAQVRATLRQAHSGHCAALVLRGDPGVGKTSLLHYARGQAGDMRVLDTTGVEAEATVAFGGLVQLLHPLRGELAGLGNAAAGELLADLLDGRVGGQWGRFAVGTAVLSALAEQAAVQPLLILVDDLHWVDPDSANALLFATRRLGADAVAVLATTRATTGTDRATAGLPEHTVDGLGADHLAAALMTHGVGPLGPGVTGWLWEETGGNPMAALELARALSAAQRAGSDPLPAVATCRTASQAFAHRVAVLSEPGLLWLRLLALAAGGPATAAAAAAAALGLSVDALAELTDAGLATLDSGRVVLGHPLVRGAAMTGCPAALAQRIHTALADALASEPDGQVQRAWHVAAGAPGPSPTVAAALADIARAARSSGAVAAASTTFEKAGSMSPPGPARGGYLTEAADCARRAGDLRRAARLVEQARPACSSPHSRARVAAVEGILAYHRGLPVTGSEVLVSAADWLPDDAAAERCRLLATAAGMLLAAGQDQSCLATAARAAALAAEHHLPVPPVVQVVQGIGRLLVGEVATGLGLIASAAPRSIGGTDAEDRAELTTLLVGVAGVCSGNPRLAREALAPLVGELRRTGALSLLPMAQSIMAYAHLLSGQITAGYAAADDARELAADTDSTDHAVALGVLAVAEAALGREADSRAHAQQARHLYRQTELGTLRDAPHALGILELERGRPGNALPYLREANSPRPGTDLSTVNPLVAPDLVDAYVRSGTPVPRWLREELHRRTGGGLPLRTASAHRCLGSLADHDTMDLHFPRALQLYQELNLPVDLARTHQAYGERLRRSGQRRTARAHLRQALDLFHTTGAQLWTERCRTELRAAGDDTADTRTPPADLTPQELQVCLSVAAGATNKEAAAALFLSEKTIEMHLSRAYRKLGIRSRSQLAARIRPPT